MILEIDYYQTVIKTQKTENKKTKNLEKKLVYVLFNRALFLLLLVVLVEAVFELDGVLVTITEKLSLSS